MRVRKLLLGAFAALLLIPPPAEAADAAKPRQSLRSISPLQNLRGFKPPVVVQNAEVLRDGHMIEIELTDAENHTLVLDMGGWRLPGNLEEMLTGVPDKEITLRSSPASADGVPLLPGGTEEHIVTQLLQGWKSSGSPMGAIKGGKRLPPPRKIAAEWRKLADQVIAALKTRDR